MWTENDLIENANDPDLAQWLELSSQFDAEPGICALRRGYALARVSGWSEIAAMRIAIKNALSILDSADKPKLGVVK